MLLRTDVLQSGTLTFRRYNIQIAATTYKDVLIVFYIKYMMKNLAVAAISARNEKGVLYLMSA